MSEKLLYFFRHGETELNRLHIIQGSGVDSDLNDTGRAQAKAFYEFHHKQSFDFVVYSALKRSKQTVQHFLDDGLPFMSTPLINEINWGIHEGKKMGPEMNVSYNWLVGEWSLGNFDARLEKGESAQELSDRLHKFFHELVQIDAQKILICTHGRTLRGIVSILKTGSIINMESVHHENTGLYVISYNNGQYNVLQENNTDHLSLMKK
jgi:probable phosphoglycerate mutase